MDEEDRSIRLVRVIDAPLDEVFRAWTDAAMIEQWLADHADADGYEGGGFRLQTEGDEDDPGEHIVSGDYLLFKEDAHLRMTWNYRGPDTPANDYSAVVDVRFRDLGEARTEIAVEETSDAQEDAQTRIFSIEAWSGAIETLADLLE